MSKIKIVGISGSPHRNGNTAKLIRRVLGGCKKAGADIEFVSLGDKKISPCRACYECLKIGRCILDDELNEIREKMINSNGIVAGSPTYNRDITGNMKIFFDRIFYDIHRQTFLGKYAVCINTHIFSSDCTQKTLRDLTMALGYYVVGTVNAKLWRFRDEIEKDHGTMKKAFNMGVRLVKSIKMQRRYLRQDLIRKFFMKPIFRKVDKLIEEKVHYKT